MRDVTMKLKPLTESDYERLMPAVGLIVEVMDEIDGLHQYSTLSPYSGYDETDEALKLEVAIDQILCEFGDNDTEEICRLVNDYRCTEKT